MTRTKIDRRSVVKGAAGLGAAAAIGTKASSAFAAPNVIQGGPVEVTWWASQSGVNGEAEQELVNRFNESQTDVQVNYQFQGSYEETAQKLTAALQARQVPEIATLSDVWWFKFYLNQAIAPLNDYVDSSGMEVADFFEPLWNEGVRQDTQFWIPMARSTPLFYYNKEAFAEGGVDESVVGNWDDIVANVDALMVKEGDNTTRYAFGHPNAASYNAWLFQCVIWAYEGAYSDEEFNILIDEEKGVEAGNFFRTSIADGWASATEDHVVDFTTGLFSSIMASTGSMGTIRDGATFEWGTAFIPEKYTFGCCTGGSGLSIMAAAEDEKKEAAFQFIEFITSPESQIYFSQTTGYMPVRQSAVDSEEMQAFYDENPQAKTAVEQLPKTAPQDEARVFIPNGDQIIGGGLEQITVNQVDAADAFAEVAQTLEEEAQPVIEQLQAIEG
jgi:sn-glycerol 3-phosphate transport system substrate-binding protein